MAMPAAYLMPAANRELDPFEWVPDSSRRARGDGLRRDPLARPRGRRGAGRPLLRAGATHRRSAGRRRGVEVLNDVVLNQVLVRFGDSDERTREVIARVQEDGTAWMGGTTWHGMAAMRISVSNWSTTEADADRSVDAILRCPRSGLTIRATPPGRPPGASACSTRCTRGRPSRVEAAHEDVGELPVDGRPIVGRYERAAVGHERVAVDREHLVVGRHEPGSSGSASHEATIAGPTDDGLPNGS